MVKGGDRMKRYIYGESVKGATHERNNSPLQDSKKIVELSDNIAIVSVADGHGSKKCPLSEFGSQMAVNVFCDVMKRYIESYSTSKKELAAFVSYLNREGELSVAKEICKEWQSRVRRSFDKRKDDYKELIDGNGNVDWKGVYSLYGTTLLGMLITDTFVFTFQIGDGDINIVTPDSVTPIVEPEKFLGTETHSLSKIDAWQKAVTSVNKKDAKEGIPYLYMLSTDGFANSYVSDSEFKRTCREYFDMIRQHGFDAVKSNLKSWLKETSELGCGDDVTLLLAYFDR